MTVIAVGERIPETTLVTMTDSGPAATTSTEILGQGRVVVFAVPGAFTPTCSQVHLPSYRDTAADLVAEGVDRIVCLAVNDPFVMAAWAAAEGVGDEIVMVSDGSADFTRAIGMEVDASRAGMGVRSRRYAMVLDEGVVTAFFPEEDGFSAIVSTGSCVLDAIKSA